MSVTKITDLTRDEVLDILEMAQKIKSKPKDFANALDRKTLIMLFEKPSLRTRVSFEVGMTQLGGHAIFYSIRDSPLGKKETIHDTGRCLSRFCDAIMARVNTRDDIKALVNSSSIPVINGLDDFAHPAQMLADMLTILEKKKSFTGLKMAYFGDACNNVTYDLMRCACLLGFELRVACPKGVQFSPEKTFLQPGHYGDEFNTLAKLTKESGGKFLILHDAKEAAKDVDVLYTDSWMSYTIDKSEESKRVEIFTPFRVTNEIMKCAKPNAIFMNCLPANRDMEQTAEVIDGVQSVVFDQAENRLHAQKSLLLFLLNKVYFTKEKSPKKRKRS